MITSGLWLADQTDFLLHSYWFMGDSHLPKPRNAKYQADIISPWHVLTAAIWFSDSVLETYSWRSIGYSAHAALAEYLALEMIFAVCYFVTPSLPASMKLWRSSLICVLHTEHALEEPSFLFHLWETEEESRSEPPSGLRRMGIHWRKALKVSLSSSLFWASIY